MEEPKFSGQSTIHANNSRTALYLGGMLVVVMLGGGYVWYTTSTPAPTAVVGQPEAQSGAESSDIVSYGLSANLAEEDTNLTGIITFSAARADQEYSEIWRYDFLGNAFTPTIEYPSRDYTEDANGEIMLIASVEALDDPDPYAPVSYDRNSGMITTQPRIPGYGEYDLSLSPSGDWYAYTYQVDSALPEFDIDAWSIALHNRITGETITIERATEPVFVGDSGLAFMHRDGISLYDIATGAVRDIFADYGNLSAIDDYSISPDAQTLILTLPNSHAIVVAQYAESNEMFYETGVHVDGVYRYRHPIISADSRFYAVTAVREDSYNEAQAKYDTATIEFRTVGSSEVIDFLLPPFVETASVVLNHWSL